MVGSDKTAPNTSRVLEVAELVKGLDRVQPNYSWIQLHLAILCPVLFDGPHLLEIWLLCANRTDQGSLSGRATTRQAIPWLSGIHQRCVT